ncbi:MAG: RNA polymerase sigma factor [Planctomycetota bacterium]|jgi:RNA polymerase sigma-70 factor (ECF subfamily)
MSETFSAPAVDDVTLSQATNGDLDALTRLLEHFGPAIRDTLSIDDQWRSSIDRDDVMQVTYIEAFRQIGRFQPRSVQSFGNWLRTVAHNNLRDAIRTLQRAKRIPPAKRVQSAEADESYAALYELLGATSTTPSRVAIRAEARGTLESAIAHLPTDYASVIRKYDLEGQSGPQVAKAMGRSRGAVFLLRMRAHDCLRERLGTASALISR